MVADSLLCLVLNSLSISFKVLAAYFLTRNCTGCELHKLMRHILKEVEDIEFFIARIVTDNPEIKSWHSNCYATEKPQALH